MKLYDVSIVTRVGTPEWPGDTPFRCGWSARIAEGSSVNLASITSSPHVGTHADAPLHVMDGGAAADALPIETFIGPALVLDVSGAARDLGPELAARVPPGTARLLLRTNATIASGRFPDEWPALMPEVAVLLAGRGLRLLGVDAPSVDRRTSKTLPVHHALFDGGGCILENLDLREVSEGRYELLAAPVRWGDVDAAPVRAVLRAIDARQG
jgi:arylformamidase